MARALSNGLIYVDDAIGRHEAAAVAPCHVDGRVVRVSAMPVGGGHLLADLGHARRLLFVETNGATGVTPWACSM